MSFDKGAFRAMVKENFGVASKPGFVPIPDAEVKDEVARDRLHKDAMSRVAASLDAAIADVALHGAASYVSGRMPELWPAGCASPDFNKDDLIKQAQALIATGSGEDLADAAVLLLTVGFLKLIKE